MSLIHATALFVTLTTESIGAALYAAWSGNTDPEIRRIALIVAGVNLVTHTLFWYSFPVGIFDHRLELLVFEVLIVVVEALVYSRLIFNSLRESLVVSSVLNLASFFAGELAWLLTLATFAS